MTDRLEGLLSTLEFITKYFKIIAHPAHHWAHACLMWNRRRARHRSTKVNKTQSLTSRCSDTLEETEIKANRHRMLRFLQWWSWAEEHTGRTPNTTWEGQVRGCMEEVFPNLNVNEQGSGMEMVGQRRQRVWVQRGETASVVREPWVAKGAGAEGKEEGRGVELSQTASAGWYKAGPQCWWWEAVLFLLSSLS